MKGKKDLKVLFLSSRVPYPPVGGDRLKNYWLLKILSKHFDVHLVTIAEEQDLPSFYKWADSLGISYKVFFKPKLKIYLNTLKGFFNPLPLQVNCYYFKDVENYLKTVYSNYDLIFATLVRTAKYVFELNKPKILDMADSIGLNYKRSQKRTRSLFWKTLYTIESERLLKFERRCIENFDKVLLVNKEEVKFFSNPEKVVWMPNGVDVRLLTYNKVDVTYKNFVAFFGKMDYQPNIDAVLWFVENVLPLLDKKIGFVIVGARPAKKILKLQEKNKRIKVTGFVEDPYKILKGCLCVVAPMQTGGGIQNKVLESMALGTINIVSSLADTGIGGTHKKHYFVLDDPEDIARLIHQIYSNPAQFENIKKEAKSFISKNYTWEIYEKKLLHIISEIKGV